PFFIGQIPGSERKGMFPELPPQEPMKSMVPEGAIIPEDTIPPETQVAQVDLDKAAEARGKLIEQLG
ncbi:hypothetical protein COS12_01870, partial [Candidatus Roizmanbacteria bacterium CG01_land_8_20_14_3_00_33_9]